jgi:hypothetical protein
MEINITDKLDLNNLADTDTSETDTGDTSGHFSEEVYKDLPAVIRSGTERLTTTDKEVFFVGSLAVLSSLLPNIQAVYDGSRIEANLYLFLYGNYGGGKGALKYCSKLAAPVHKYLKELPAEVDPDTGQTSAKKLHYLPANSSKSGLIELLATNGRGLIFETEADSLTDILKQDYGNFSDILRQAYHHETIRFYRRLNKEFFEIEEPKLSVLLSGTPGQLKKLVPGVESGLFSRFLYFGLEADHQFKNVFDTSGGDLQSHFNEIGAQILPLYTWLTQLPEPYIFRLQTDQEAEFLAYFQDLKNTLIDTYGDSLAGSVNRFAIQFFRIAMILTTIRAYADSELRPVLYCYDIDFKNAQKIMEVFIYNALQIFDSLAAQNLDSLPQNKQQFFAELPEEFTTDQAIKKGLELKFSERTVTNYLQDRQLFDYVKYANYKKRK